MTPTILLRRIILLDAATCAGTGLLLALGAGALAEMLHLPAMLLREAGIFLLLFTLFVLWAGRQTRPRAAPVQILIAANVAWVAASLALVAGPWLDPNPLGTAFIAAQAAAVAAIAGLQLVGLRRAQAEA